MINLTERAQGFCAAASSAAQAADHPSITDVHLLSALLADHSGRASRLLTQAGADVPTLRQALDAKLGRIAKVHGTTPTVDRSFARVLEHANKHARDRHDRFVSAETLLLALIEIGETAKLAKTADAKRLAEAIASLKNDQPVNSATEDQHYEAIKTYARDLTEDAKHNRLDPVIGRDDEIRRMIQVLSRRTKNNPVLIGEPGVGKTALVEGLALRIVSQDVPESLQHKRVLMLDIGQMLAGAKFRGEFEERLKAVLKEIEAATDNVICFIDELHTLVGAGSGEGSLDASNLLKPALARGLLHCIGATTLDEYRKYIEKDAALARRFQPIVVSQPSVEDTLAILRGIRESYEIHHGVKIRDSALVAAARLSDRYIRDRFLPDKAIDLIDEAASRLRMELESKPEAIDALERQITHLLIEKEALKTDVGDNSSRVKTIQDKLSQLQQEAETLTQQWKQEKESTQTAQTLKEEIAQHRLALAQAQRDGDYARAGELLYGVIPELEQRLQTMEVALSQSEQRLRRDAVTENDIAQIVERWSGVPVAKMLASEREKLLHIERDLRARVVGQDDTIDVVARALRRSRTGLSDPNRPLGSFLFLGPTGVGKTELCKAMAGFLFDDDKAILRFDMSEFMEPHAVAKLIGAPPGYVGYEQGGALTESIRRRPYQVILFDEIEKAHADLFHILLQILDEGRLTDSHGRVVDFRQTLIVLTSNIGSEFLSEPQRDAQRDAETPSEARPYSAAERKKVLDALAAQFRPEFLNRLDAIELFARLTKQDIERILDIQLARINQRLAEQEVSVRLTDSAKAFIIAEGFVPIYGARPLKRALQRHVEDAIASAILDERVPEHGAFVFDHQPTKTQNSAKPTLTMAAYEEQTANA